MTRTERSGSATGCIGHLRYGSSVTIFCMLRSTFVLFLSVTTGIPALQAGSQTCGVNAQSPIATDRPQITSSSVVVPCGSLQFENGFQETGNGGQRSFDLPETAVRFGIVSKTELRFAAPDYVLNDDTASGFANGFGDLSGASNSSWGQHGADLTFRSYRPSAFRRERNRYRVMTMIQPSNCPGHAP